jgi:hypothetical protein
MFLSASREEFAMKRFCSGICVVRLFSTFASSQADESESKQRDGAASYSSATLLKLTTRGSFAQIITGRQK